MARRGVNKVIIVGNLGEEPAIRWTGGGEAVANFNVATSDVWKDKQTGERQERTEWHRMVCFGPLAEICGKFLQKGTKVYCDGELRTKKWTDTAGIDRYTTQVRVNEMQILSGGIQVVGDGQSATPPPPGQAQGNYHQQQARGAPPPDARYNANGTQTSPYANMPPPQDFDGFDDDIPF